MVLTNAQIVLAAVQAAIDADLPYLHLLAQRHKLKAELVLRILLTFLPESTEPATYLPLLKELNGGGNGLPESLADATEERRKNQEHVSSQDAPTRVKSVRFLPLTVRDQVETTSTDALSPSLTAFLLLRARRIDSETGNLPLAQQLLESFVDQSTYLKLWLGSTILPLLRLNYELFPNREEPIALDDFESLRGGAALDTLIGGRVDSSTTAEHYARDLKQIVGPWMYGEIYRRRRRAPSTSASDEEIVPWTCWSWVNNWLMHIANKDPVTALNIMRDSQWSGPGDVDDGGWFGDDPQLTEWIWGASTRADAAHFKSTMQAYMKTCLCLFFTIDTASEQSLDLLEHLLVQVADAENQGDDTRLVLHESSPQAMDASVLPADFLDAVRSRGHRLQPADLLEDNHPLTSLGPDSLALAAHLLRSARIMLRLGQAMPISKVLHMSLLGTVSEQRVLLHRITQRLEDKKVGDDECDTIRTRLLEVTTIPKSSSQSQPCGVFGTLFFNDPEELDGLILKAEINSARYRHVISNYLVNGKERLSRKKVEIIAVQVAAAAFDSASNGNRTRGGVKKAADIVAAFSPVFPVSTSLQELEALIRATHALSFYKLTLQHGVPCVPVNVRVHSHPLALIDKVLSQNPQSYAQLDNLIKIGIDLVRAGLVKTASSSLQHGTLELQNQEKTAATISREITSKAISAALEEDDFDTAYSYIVTRLVAQASATSGDDILWRAAYSAGKSTPAKSRNNAHQLRRLEQKMELLSQALSLAPASALTEVLSTWQECETQINEALAAEDEADERWNVQGDKRAVDDRHLPGGFGAEAYIPNAEGTGGRQGQAGRRNREEAPMGLFDVARAAGSALQKSAFPLRGAERGQAQTANDEDSGAYAEAQRIRKRDVVSNAVTSGLVSSIGWVIGATPSRDN